MFSEIDHTFLPHWFKTLSNVTARVGLSISFPKYIGTSGKQVHALWGFASQSLPQKFQMA